MDYTSLLPWVPLLGVLIACITLIIQVRRSRFSLSIDLLIKFNVEYTNPEFRKLRWAAARSIHDRTYHEAGRILDFFDIIGVLVRRKALDPELVWHSFFHPIHRYRRILDAHISAVRKEDPVKWADFVLLHQRLARIHVRKRGCSERDLELTQDDIDEFLRAEARSAAEPGGA